MRESMINQMKEIDKLIDKLQPSELSSISKFNEEMGKILCGRNTFNIDKSGTITFGVKDKR